MDWFHHSCGSLQLEMVQAIQYERRNDILEAHVELATGALPLVFTGADAERLQEATGWREAATNEGWEIEADDATALAGE